MKYQIPIAYAMSIFKSLIYAFALLIIGNLLDNISLFDVLALRFLFSAAGVIFLRMIGAIKINLKGKNITALLIVAILQPIIYFIFEALGIKNTTTVTAGLIFSLIPLVTVVSEKIILKESANGKQKLFMCLVIIGAMICTVMSSTGSSGKSELIGIIFILIALISDGLHMTCSRKASRVFSSFEITYIMAITGAVVFNIINIIIHLRNNTTASYFTPLYKIENVIAFAYLGIVCSIVAVGMHNYTLSKIQASTISSLSGLYTIFAIMLGVIFNNEALQIYHIIGAVLIIVGGIGANYYRNKTLHIENYIHNEGEYL